MSGGPRRKLRSASTRISGIVSVGGDEQRVVSVNDERAVTVWDAQKATPIGTTFSPHNGKVTCVALTARVIISGGSDGFLRLWNLGAEDSAVSLQAHLGAVLCMAVVSHTLATGGVDGVIKVYEIRQAGVLQTVVLYGHAAAVTGVALLPPPPARAGASAGPADLVSCSLDGTVRVWSLAAGKAIECVECGAPCTAVGADPARVAVGLRTGEVVVMMRVGAYPVVLRVALHTKPVTGLSLRGGLLATCASDGLAWLLNLDEGRPLGAVGAAVKVAELASLPAVTAEEAAAASALATGPRPAKAAKPPFRAGAGPAKPSSLKSRRLSAALATAAATTAAAIAAASASPQSPHPPTPSTPSPAHHQRPPMPSPRRPSITTPATRSPARSPQPSPGHSPIPSPRESPERERPRPPSSQGIGSGAGGGSGSTLTVPGQSWAGRPRPPPEPHTPPTRVSPTPPPATAPHPPSSSRPRAPSRSGMISAGSSRPSSPLPPSSGMGSPPSTSDLSLPPECIDCHKRFSATGKFCSDCGAARPVVVPAAVPTFPPALAPSPPPPPGSSPSPSHYTMRSPTPPSVLGSSGSLIPSRTPWAVAGSSSVVSFALEDDLSDPLAEMVRANASLQEWAKANIDSKLKLCEFEVSVVISLGGKPVRTVKMSTKSDLRVVLEPNDEPIQCEVRGDEDADEDRHQEPQQPPPAEGGGGGGGGPITLTSSDWDALAFRGEMLCPASGTKHLVLDGAMSRHQLVIAQKEEDYLEAGTGARVTLPQAGAQSAFRLFFFPGFVAKQGRVDIIKNFEAIISLEDIASVTQVTRDSEGWARLVEKV